MTLARQFLLKVLLSLVVVAGDSKIAVAADGLCKQLEIEIAPFGPEDPWWWESARRQYSKLRIKGEDVAEIDIHYSDLPFGVRVEKKEVEVKIGDMKFNTHQGVKPTYFFWSNPFPAHGYFITIRKAGGDSSSGLYLRSQTYNSVSIDFDYDRLRTETELLTDIYCFLKSDSLKRGLK